MALGFYSMMNTWYTTNGTLMVGLGMVRIKAAITAAVAAIYITGSWFALMHIGLIGVPIAGCLGFSVDAALSLPLALRKIRLASAALRPGDALLIEQGAVS